MRTRLPYSTLLGIFFVLLLMLIPAGAPALADAPTVLYAIEGPYAFQEGCFGACYCPVRAADMKGTFGLTAGPRSGNFSTWTVSEVDWRVSTGSRLTGTGLYRLSQGSDPRQQLILDLSLDGGPVERYDSGVVPAMALFPKIDATVSLFGMQCWDRVLAVRASPAGPVTFRFEGRVESVFDGIGALGGQVARGDRFHGSFTFDTRTPNTAEPVGEGEAGLYHHDSPPAGVRIRIKPFTFQSVPGQPDFDVIVNNDFGFAGADEFGFISRNNQARGLYPSPPIGRLDLRWLASTFNASPLSSAELPRTPPDLDLLGGGTLVIEGECTLCLAPAAFFRIEGTLTSLTDHVRLSVDHDALRWDGPPGSAHYDVIQGDIDTLRSGFANATTACVADDHPGTVMYLSDVPAPGQILWYLVRDHDRSWDSIGFTQQDGRDQGVIASGRACP